MWCREIMRIAANSSAAPRRIRTPAYGAVLTVAAELSGEGAETMAIMLIRRRDRSKGVGVRLARSVFSAYSFPI